MSAGDVFQVAHYCCADSTAKEHWMDKNRIHSCSIKIDHAAAHDLTTERGEVKMLCWRITEAAIGQWISPRME